jgi:hypothetical protein
MPFLPGKCEMPGCGKPIQGRRLCHKHYQYARNHGLLPPKEPYPLRGNKSPRWVGDKVGYFGLHDRVYAERGKADRCIVFLCGTGSTTFEWANISGQYKDVADFMPMCIPHHKLHDNALLKAVV